METDILSQVTNSCIKKISDARDKQIIECLKHHGFEFKNRKELIEFAKTRCHIEIHPMHVNRLFVDKTLIAEWEDTTHMKIDGNMITMTQNWSIMPCL